MNLTGKQIFGIIGAVLSVITLSTTQLTDLIGPGATKTVVSLAALANTILQSVIVIISGQGSLVTDVQAMPGVEKITINAQANPTLAKLATADENPKIEAAKGAESAVSEAAKG